MYNSYYVYGIHAVTSALMNEKRDIVSIFIANEDILTDNLLNIIKKRNLSIKYSRAFISSLLDFQIGENIHLFNGNGGTQSSGSVINILTISLAVIRTS